MTAARLACGRRAGPKLQTVFNWHPVGAVLRCASIPSCPAREPLLEEDHERDWFNGSTKASQALDTGSIPVSRSIKVTPQI